ncbi:MAG: hypothetical protein M3Z26_17575 [Bacteroidota bacterium]|nr:hypothetical protein [Bacteroidota bacterium]
MKPYTTSAQKTIKLSQDESLQKLEDELTRSEKVIFENTNHENIRSAKMEDGSVLVIASFIKDNGLTLAMIDHKKISAETKREDVQKKWRNKSDKIF